MENREPFQRNGSVPATWDDPAHAEAKSAEPRPLLVDAQRAAELLSVSRAKIYLMMQSGELSYVEIGRSRLKRIPYAIIEQYIEKNLRNAAHDA